MVSNKFTGFKLQIHVFHFLFHEIKDSESLKKGEADISLEIVPRNHPLVKMTELREEGGSMLETLLTLIASPTISRLVNKPPRLIHLCINIWSC